MTDLAMLFGRTPFGRLAAATPSPDPTDAGDLVRETAAETAEATSQFWEWFTGWPLQVLLLLVIGLLVLLLIRRAIHQISERIANGYHRAYREAIEAASNPDAPDAERGTRKGKAPKVRSMLVEDALLSPEAKQRRAHRARTVGSVLRNAANIIVLSVMALMILSAVGAGDVVAPLLTSAGVVGVAVGFGAQSLVRDFLSGVFILVEDQYGVGDVVDLGFGVAGTVEKMDLRLTHVRAFDGTLWHVRNGEILRAGNRTQQWARAVATIGVPVGSDTDRVRAALGRAIDGVVGDARFSSDLMETPTVRGVDELTDGAYTFTVHGRVRPGADGDVARALLERAQAELVRAGIIVTSATDSTPPELRPDSGRTADEPAARSEG